MNFDPLCSFLNSLIPYGIPGLECTVHIGYEEVFYHSAGFADVENRRKVAANDLYYMYSVSKLITCTAALQLWEQGKFLMYDPIALYLPEFEGTQVKHSFPNGKCELRPAREPVTIWHLFTMTSGISYQNDTKAIKTLVAETAGKASTREMVKAIAQTPLLFEPGSHWAYGFSHDVLAALVEVISGKKFGDYVREHIFLPLGMNDSYFKNSPEIADRVLPLYKYAGKGIPAEREYQTNEKIFGWEYESGGGGLISNLRDYARFAEMLSCGGTGRSGARILAESTVRMLHTDTLNAQTRPDFRAIRLRGYGYGFGVRTMVDLATAGANGTLGEFGWNGAAGMYVLCDPERKMTLVYAQHMLDNQEDYINPRLRNIVYSCI